MLLDGWTDEHTAKFQKDIFKVKHRLNETGLFTDEALAELLDKHPKDKLDVCARGDHPIFEFKFRTGDVRDVDGATLIDAVKNGSIWMNLRKAMNIHPEYKAVLDEMYSEVAKAAGQKPLNPRGGILISSPTAKVPYHFDATETILWHVRGHKRMYLYPETEEFLNDKDYEALMFRETEDYLPYNADMDKSATCFDLHDGEMITWPLNSPHRVENKSYCVSVTTEYSTRESSFKNSVMYANAVMRRKFGMDPQWRSASMSKKVIKAGLGVAFRKVGVLNDLKADDLVSFVVDKEAPNFIRDVEPFQRSF